MAADAHDHGHSGHHITPIKTLLLTFGFLTLMMVLTIAAARAPLDMPEMFGWMQPFWWLTNSIALGIAILKAVAVVQVFMGVKYTTKLVRLYAVGGFVWFGTIYIMAIDYASRPWEPVKGWESGVPAAALPRDPHQDAGTPLPKYEPQAGASNEGGGHH